MIQIEENSNTLVLKIKERAVAARDTKRKGEWQRFYFFDMQPRIAPVFLKTLFLFCIVGVNLLGKFFERSNKIARLDYFHKGGYVLSAFRYERWMRTECEYPERSSSGRRSEISRLRSRSSVRIFCINKSGGPWVRDFIYTF